MDGNNRITLLGMIVEEPDSAEKINALLHEYGSYIVGRMGIPYRSRGVAIIPSKVIRLFPSMPYLPETSIQNARRRVKPPGDARKRRSASLRPSPSGMPSSGIPRVQHLSYVEYTALRRFFQRPVPEAA